MDIKLNETPVRTSRNFNINNITLKDLVIPERINNFENMKIVCNTSKIKIEENTDEYFLTYGISKDIINQVKNNSNKRTKIIIDSITQKEISIDFEFDNESLNLVQDIEIIANENTKATVIIKFYSKGEINGYNNSVIRTIMKKGANLNVILVNFMNSKSINFFTIQNDVYENAKLNYNIIDFGGRYSLTNYYSNLIGDISENLLNTIYLGTENQIFDLNYIADLKGKNTNISIEVQGALKDAAKKHFKGTIDFKKGAKKATGNENESCILLSKEAKSISLPMLLCSEEDVEGNHSSSAGKIEDKELFYLMSRGFCKNEAMKLMVKARFNKIIENIKNEILKEEIINEIDKRLD